MGEWRDEDGGGELVTSRPLHVVPPLPSLTFPPPLCLHTLVQICFAHENVSERFLFNRFMEVAVARLARKPLRISLTLDR